MTERLVEETPNLNTRITDYFIQVKRHAIADSGVLPAPLYLQPLTDAKKYDPTLLHVITIGVSAP